MSVTDEDTSVVGGLSLELGSAAEKRRQRELMEAAAGLDLSEVNERGADDPKTIERRIRAAKEENEAYQEQVSHPVANINLSTPDDLSDDGAQIDSVAGKVIMRNLQRQREAKQAALALQRTAQRNVEAAIGLKSSDSVREHAFDVAQTSAEKTQTTKDDEWVAGRGFIDTVEDDTYDYSIKPHDMEFGQF